MTRMNHEFFIRVAESLLASLVVKIEKRLWGCPRGSQNMRDLRPRSEGQRHVFQLIHVFEMEQRETIAKEPNFPVHCFFVFDFEVVHELLSVRVNLAVRILDASKVMESVIKIRSPALRHHSTLVGKVLICLQRYVHLALSQHPTRCTIAPVMVNADKDISGF